MIEEILNRRSIRKYKATTISPAIIEDVLSAAIMAPSGDNSQPWHFIVIEDREMRQRLMEVSNHQQWMMTAPVFIACVADLQCRIQETKGIVLNEDTALPELKLIIRDTAIAIEHLVIEAMHYDLGTCWIAWYKQEEIRPILGVADDKYVVSILTLGYPDENPKPKKRRTLAEVTHYDKW